MKRWIALIICVALVLSGCAQRESSKSTAFSTATTASSRSTELSQTEESTLVPSSINETTEEKENTKSEVHFTGLDDATLITYVENQVYDNLIVELDSDDYFIENIDAVYLSKEYIEEVEYNSAANLFFGFTIEELEEQFQGQRYVFTLGDNGQTTVVPMEEVYDDTYSRVMKNVAIGGGVILLCVTVSSATVSMAPAVSAILAVSAKTGTVLALETGGISFMAAALAKGYQTHDFEQALKAGALAGSESFKWGAIVGAVKGGISEGKALSGATLNGLSMNEAARIQQESKWPLDAIKNLHSVEEYEIYKNANLIPTQLSDGSWAFLRKIDWLAKDSFGRTNVQRVAEHLAPVDPTGVSYELHHIGQRADSPLAILTEEEHRLNGNSKILHYAETGKDVADDVWAAQKREFWEAVLDIARGG